LNRRLQDIPAPEALAGEEFSEAWEPRDIGATSATEGGQADATPAAVTAIRDREARIASARTEEERAAINRDRSIYRVALTFTAAEADLVKAVLGDRPAERLIEVCQHWSTTHPVPAT